MIGDLHNGRTIHSLSKLLSLFPEISINLISPEILRLPQEIRSVLEKRGVKVREDDRLDEVLRSSDVLYMTRVQKERFTDLGLYNQLKHNFVITPRVMQQVPDHAILMHPLPRVGEIESEVDKDPRSLYINEQMSNGMYVRMALLALVLKENI
jgi:aspartate carbamoyltransferase catalytic subunit